MSRFLISLVLLISTALTADLQKFSGPAYKSAAVKSTTQVYASVDPKTSQVGALLGWAKKGDALEVLAVYSTFLKLQAKASGWAWIELLKVEGDSAICDPDTEGRLGVALASEPNNYTTITGALHTGEAAKIVDYWPRWVKVKFNGQTGFIFATEVSLSQ